MPLLSSPTVSSSPLLFSSPSKPQGLTYRGLGIEKEKNVCSQRTILPRLISAGDGKSGSSVEYDVPFPSDYTQLLQQFFPEASEVTFARKSAFGGCSLKLDYLTKPSFFEDFGFVSKVKMADRVKPEDELFIVGYPYFNVNEMLVVEELYKEAVVNTSRKLIIFNGELDRIRSGYYPPFFYPKLGALSQTLLPKMETVYYIHNFKGRNAGVLFRCYPGPWKVLRKVRNKYYSVHEQEDMPSLKQVALDILPST
ncbi:UNVERIFIED_CONTAM: hypothetical protein Sradi_6800300 [Sesamum radiatum]|uniref:DUF1995 domain-containing protein n=1 Tax=Sesamum radiatum TaxID=300843 RepID=A0AAW2JS59_SESRA